MRKDHLACVLPIVKCEGTIRALAPSRTRRTMVVRVGRLIILCRPNLVRILDDRFPLSHTGEATMAQFLAAAKKFVVAEEGASLVEYALLVALIAVVCIGGITALGGSINTMFQNLSGSLPSGSAAS